MASLCFLVADVNGKFDRKVNIDRVSEPMCVRGRFEVPRQTCVSRCVAFFFQSF